MSLAREVDILNYLPAILHEIKELQTVAEMENPTLEKVWDFVESALNNQFVLLADERGIARHEKILSIKAGATEDVETRRFRVLSRYQEQAPYTYPVLKELLNSLLGEGKYEMTRNVAEKWLKVRMELTVSRQFEVVEMLLERVTPQTLVLTVELRYNQWSKVKTLTWGELLNRTWIEVKEEVI